MIILITLLEEINSLTFFPLAKAKEEISENDTLLLFTIKGAVDFSFSKNISFSIEVEFYANNELLSKENYVNCHVPAAPKAKFGTHIIARCEYDLIESPLADTMLFTKFISNKEVLKIDDQNKYIINEILNFSKKINITSDYEYIVEKIETISCSEKEYTFGIKGEINKIFITSFTFDLTINPASGLIAECESPYIYFKKKTMINCTIELLNDDKNFVDKLNKGIVIKEKFYKVINDEAEEKILIIKINSTKIELKDLNCNNEDNQDNNNEEKNITDNQEEESDIKNEDKADNIDKNENKSKEIEGEKDEIIDSANKYNKSEHDNEYNDSKNNIEDINSTIMDDSNEKDKAINNNKKINDIEQKDDSGKSHDEINITETEIIKDDELNNKTINDTKESLTLENEEKENKTKDNTSIKGKNKDKDENTDFEEEKIKVLLNKDKNNSLINNTKNKAINETKVKEEIDKTTKKNEHISHQKEDILNETNSNQEIETEKEEIKDANNSTKNNSIEVDSENIMKSSFISNEPEVENNNFDNKSNIKIDNITEKEHNRDIRGDLYANIWRAFDNRNKNKKNQTEIVREEQRGREWERQKEEERKKKEEEERLKKEERKRKEQEEIFKVMKEREEKERKERAEKARKESEERQRLENERLEKIRRENLRKTDKNYQNNNNTIKGQNNSDEVLNQNNIDAKLIHVQFTYSFGTLYYILYALSPIPKGHRIKINLSISKFNYINGYSSIEEKSVILTTEEEIDKDGNSIIIEYTGSLECKDCRKIILNKTNIQGATIYRIPEQKHLRDAFVINRNNFISKNKIQSPLLYITENISNKNCNIDLIGNFFNKNKFFASKFSLLLISTENKDNITISCQLNERSIFSCPISVNLVNYSYILEEVVTNKKENIIIENSMVTKNNMSYIISCENENNKVQVDENKIKNLKDSDTKVTKKTSITKIILFIISIIIILYLIIDCCCGYEKEPEYQYSSSSTGAISNKNYIGETSGLINRRW